MMDDLEVGCSEPTEMDTLRAKMRELDPQNGLWIWTAKGGDETNKHGGQSLVVAWTNENKDSTTAATTIRKGIW